jgi:hypothetical protein
MSGNFKVVYLIRFSFCNLAGFVVVFLYFADRFLDSLISLNDLLDNIFNLGLDYFAYILAPLLTVLLR